MTANNPMDRSGDRPLPDGKLTCPRSVIGGDYEVLGLQVTVATVFGNCFGAYVFADRFLGASSGVGQCEDRSCQVLRVS